MGAMPSRHETGRTSSEHETRCREEIVRKVKRIAVRHPMSEGTPLTRSRGLIDAGHSSSAQASVRSGMQCRGLADLYCRRNVHEIRSRPREETED